MTTNQLTTNEIAKLTRQVAAMYIETSPDATLGQWVMSTYYKDVYLADEYTVRSFVGAQRTFDARMYLSALLRSGSLDPKPLQESVANTVISEQTLSFVI